MTPTEAAEIRAFLRAWFRDVYGARYVWPEDVEGYWLRLHREIRREERR